MEKRKISTQKSVKNHYQRLKTQLETTKRMYALLLTLEPEDIIEYDIFFDKDSLSLTAENENKEVKVEVSWSRHSERYFLEVEDIINYRDYVIRDVDKAAKKFIELLEKHLSK